MIRELRGARGIYMSSLLSSIEDVCPLESRRSSRRSKRHLAGWRPSHGRKPCILTGDLVEHHAPSWPRHANRSRVSVVSHAKHSQTSGPFYLRNKSKPTKTTLASLTMETACGEISMCQHLSALNPTQSIWEYLNTHMLEVMRMGWAAPNTGPDQTVKYSALIHSCM
jgi:hypothetical protein